jgi:hypothetical protein
VCSEIVIAVVVFVRLIMSKRYFIKFDVSDYMNFVSARIIDAILIFLFIVDVYVLSESIVKLFDFFLENVHSRR